LLEKNNDFYIYKYKTIWCPFTKKYFIFYKIVIKGINAYTLITFRILEGILKNTLMIH
jgi:hypothetical protein